MEDKKGTKKLNATRVAVGQYTIIAVLCIDLYITEKLNEKLVYMCAYYFDSLCVNATIGISVFSRYLRNY